MVKELQDAIRKVKSLPADRQVEAATLLDEFVEQSTDIYVLSEAEERMIDEAVAEIDAGEIVSDAEMEAFWQRHKK